MTARRAVAAVAACLVAAQGGGWRARPEVVARAAAAQPEFNFDEARVPPYALPGALGRSAALERFRASVYGRAPGRPERLRFDATARDTAAMGGAATLERVEVVSGVGAREHRFALTLFLPNRVGRAPVFLLLNNRPATNADPTRATRSGFWPAEALIARGYGIAAVQVSELAPDDSARFRDGVIRLFDADAARARPSDAWGALAAWAWGASRAMDYLAAHRRVDARRVAVVGHSRGGKAALWAGAQDERFALVVSNESGEGGAALSRRAFGETVARITTTFPHWFAPAYATFAGRERDLPVDQHQLLALVAPRALYVASADEDLWSDPRGEFLALAAASSAWAGEPPIRAGDMPPLDQPLVVGHRAYHVRSGGHDLTPWDWARFADFADRIWARRE